jgi:hypothetical protein
LLAGEDKAVVTMVTIRALVWLQARGFDWLSATPIVVEMAETLEHHYARDRDLLVGLAAMPGDSRGASFFVADKTAHAALDAWADERHASGAALFGQNVALVAAELRAAHERKAVRHVH